MTKFKQTMMSTLVATGLLFSAGSSFAKKTDTMVKLNDGATVSVSGTIKKVAANEFHLDYGQGTIPVEFDNWYWEGTNANYLTNYFKAGDMVTVNGEVEDGFFTSKEIIATKVTKIDPASFNVAMNDYLSRTVYEYTPGKMSTLKIKK